jgi:hypothetical protein
MNSSAPWSNGRPNGLMSSQLHSSVRGHWGAAKRDSDIDLVVLTDNPSAYLAREDWIAPLAPGAELLRIGDWGTVAERRFVLRSGLEVGGGPFSAGFDHRGLLADLAAACRGVT